MTKQDSNNNNNNNSTNISQVITSDPAVLHNELSIQSNLKNGIPLDTLRLSSIEQARSDASMIVTTRKRKIAELYTVATLRKLRSITTEDEVKAVKSDLEGFLERCDLERGIRFDMEMLNRDVDMVVSVKPLVSMGNNKELGILRESQTVSSSVTTSAVVKQKQPDIKDSITQSINSSSTQANHQSSQSQLTQSKTISSSTAEIPAIESYPAAASNKVRVDLDLVTKLKSLSQSQAQVESQNKQGLELIQNLNNQRSSSSSPQIPASSQTTKSQENTQRVASPMPATGLSEESNEVISNLGSKPHDTAVNSEEQISPKCSVQLSTDAISQRKSQSNTLSQEQSTRTATSGSSTTSSTSELIRQPIPQLQSQQIQPHKAIIDKISKKPKVLHEKKSLFDPNSPETIETLVLVLKENLPAKIVESTPLAELYYLAQTLPLAQLLPAAHKVVTTSVFESAFTEGKINVIHSRIEDLKWQGKWSLRQPTKYMDPFKTGKKRTHWDNTMSEMNWMSTDFRELRKFKIATCAFIAESVMDFWKYGRVCCVKPAPINYLSSDEDVEMEDLECGIAEEGNTLESDEEFSKTKHIDISKILGRPDLSAEIKPRELPDISFEDFEKIKKDEISIFKPALEIDDLKHNDRMLLDNLPSFTSFDFFNDKFEKLPLAPVSRSLVPIEDDSWYTIYSKQQKDQTPFIPSQQKGLFGFSSQKRISATIKPPEPPFLKYLDTRAPAIWLPEEDQRLIEYVNQFSFNWGIVSAHIQQRMTQHSYLSNIERRSPWQCFERYIQLNDAFDINEMRGQYHHNAMQWLKAAHQLQATTKRRISPLGVGPDSIQRGHKKLRWASVLDAVRKRMKKSENIARPNPVQSRKFVDDKIRESTTPTPGDLSQLKYQREKDMHDRYLQEHSKKLPNGINQRRIGTPVSQARSNSSHTSHGPTQAPQIINSVPHTGHSQPGVQMQVAPQSADQIQASLNASPLVQQAILNRATVQSPMGNKMGATNVIQGQTGAISQQQRMISSTSPNANRQYTPDQFQQILQAQKQKKIQQQHQLQLQQRQQKQQQQQAAQLPLSVDGVPQMVPNSARLTSNNIQMASSSPGITSSSTVPRSNSPSVEQVPKIQFDRKHMAMLTTNIKKQNPSWSAEQVTTLAHQILTTHNQKIVNSALNNQRSSQSQSPQTQQRGLVPTPQQILEENTIRSASPNMNINTQLKMRPNVVSMPANQTNQGLELHARQIKQAPRRTMVPTPQQIQAQAQAQAQAQLQAQARSQVHPINPTLTPQEIQARQQQIQQQRMQQQQQNGKNFNNNNNNNNSNNNNNNNNNKGQ